MLQPFSMNNKIALTIFTFFLSVSVLLGQNNISRKEAIADIDTLISTLERVHYNPYLHISKQTFDFKVKSIIQSLKDSIPFKDFILSLYSLTASLQDGHCMPAIVQPAIVPELKNNNFLPFSFIFYADDVYISKSDYEILGIPFGSKIKSINNISLVNAKKEFQTFFGGSENFTQEMSNRLMGYFLFLKGVQPPFIITFTTQLNNDKTIILDAGVMFTEMMQKSMPHIKGKNEYRIIDDKIAYLNYISMNGDLYEWGEFLDSLFKDIQEKEIKALCIDVRNNSGGNSLFNNFLLAYITDKEFLQSSGKSWKVSYDYKNYQLANGIINSEYQSKENGSIWTYENCDPIENLVTVDSIFNGKVYLLTGAFTFSSANMLADAFKTFRIGTIIGEATGEFTNDFGEVMPIVLPNSKIKIQLTTSFEFGADCNKNEFHTIIPDIIVKPTLKNKLSEIDEVLAYLLNIIVN
jgi:hypothetical protein